MVNAANILGVLAAVLLIMAVIAWVKLLRGPLLQRLDGRAGVDPAQGEFASQLLICAAALSTAAATLAIAGWVYG